MQPPCARSARTSPATSTEQARRELDRLDRLERLIGLFRQRIRLRLHAICVRPVRHGRGTPRRRA